MASAIAIPAQGAVDADVITLATTAKSEITALQAGTSIAGVNGVTMPAGGALTTGAVLRATGVATAAYGAVNLASSDAVTGLLPTANLAPGTAAQIAVTNAGATAKVDVSLSGDATMVSTGVVTVAKVNGTSVPAGGALTTGNAAYVSGAAAATYSALNLAGGAGWVSGVLPAANLPLQVAQITLVAGTLTLAAGITITAASRVIPVLVTPGAGASGTRYAVSGLTVGGAGVGAFTVTAKDSGAGDNTVNTDVSVLDCIIIG